MQTVFKRSEASNSESFCKIIAGAIVIVLADERDYSRKTTFKTSTNNKNINEFTGEKRSIETRNRIQAKLFPEKK